MVNWRDEGPSSRERSASAPQFPGEREAMVAAWEGSEQTQGEFARAHGLAVGTLRNWIRRHREATPPVALREVALGEVLGAPRRVAEIRRSDGTVIRVAAEV